jgi:hypothetical protein
MSSSFSSALPKIPVFASFRILFVASFADLSLSFRTKDLLGMKAPESVRNKLEVAAAGKGKREKKKKNCEGMEMKRGRMEEKERKEEEKGKQKVSERKMEKP